MRITFRVGGLTINLGWLEASFLALLLLALALRLWELGGRSMHYDEGLHVHYAWRLANSEGRSWGWPWIFGRDYIHSPWMHGPFQIEFTALVFRLFGDSDVTARLGYVLFGSALVALPYFLRDYLGRAGSLVTALLLALSPSLLYFSRFGREDILMAFWVTALLVLMWRYIHEGKHRYLYLASAVLAFMFATKETAYFVVLIFGAIMFLLALPALVPWALGRIKASELVGPAGFFLLLLALTLPQWSAATGLVQGVLGVTLVNPNGVPNGLVGAPHWVAPLVIFPVYHAPWWLHGPALAVLVGGTLWVLGRHGPRWRSLMVGIGVPLLVVAATGLAVGRPLAEWLPSGGTGLLALALAGAMALAAVTLLVRFKRPWKEGALLVVVPALFTLVYLGLFTPVLDVEALANGLLPATLPRVDASASGVPVNFLVAGGVVAATILVSVYLGVSWRGGVWLGCAAIFYLVWITLYTTFFANRAGVFTGVWQGMGYWVAQQDVARGNQPWYYYFVGLSVYELLPALFGLLGAIYFLRKGDAFGLALAAWAVLTLLAYTVASEKMPWLLVHLALPLVLLSGKYLGELVERVPWRQALRRGYLVLLVLPPLAVLAGVNVLYRYVAPPGGLSGLQWGVLAGAGLLAVASAYLVRLAGSRAGLALAGLGLAALFLAFGTQAAFRAAYTYDDSNQEILVFAQGSADVAATYRNLNDRVFSARPLQPPVQVDYDLWYPFQWYVRHQQKAGSVRFFCVKEKGEPGWGPGCSGLAQRPQAPALLLSLFHGSRDSSLLLGYRREGPYRNLLWFPESYRRPDENRQGEGMKQELGRDLKFFQQAATSRRSWREGLDYLLFRRLDRPWFQSEYYAYLAE